MIVVRVLFTTKPQEDHAVLEHMRKEVEAVRKMEGCLHYHLARVPETNQFLLYEEWSSREAFEAYRASEIMAEARKVLMPRMAGPPESAYYEAAKFDA